VLAWNDIVDVRPASPIGTSPRARESPPFTAVCDPRLRR